MVVRYVTKEQLPEGHTWALVERDGVTTAFVVDSLAERVARRALLQLQQSGQ